MTRSAVQICLTAPNKKASLLRCFFIFVAAGIGIADLAPKADPKITARSPEGHKKDPAYRRASAFTDIIFFIAEDQIVHIGDTMLHERTTFPREYSEEPVSNTTKTDCIVFYAVRSILEMLFFISFKVNDQIKNSVIQYSPAHTIVLPQFGAGGMKIWMAAVVTATPKAVDSKKEGLGTMSVRCMSLWKLRKKFITWVTVYVKK